MKNPRNRVGRLASWVKPWALLAVQSVATILSLSVGHASVADVAGDLQGSLAGFQNLLLLVAMAMLGAGLALKFLPTGSHRTKDAAGQLVDNALILGGLLALGLWLVYFAGQVAVKATGQGAAPTPGGPWELPGSNR